MIALLHAVIVALEIVRRLPFLAAFREMARAAARARRILPLRRASDHWKERAIRTLAGRLFGRSLLAACFLALVAAPILLVLLLDRPLALGAMASLLDWPARLQLAALALTYALLRHVLVRRLRPR